MTTYEKLTKKNKEKYRYAWIYVCGTIMLVGSLVYQYIVNDGVVNGLIFPLILFGVGMSSMNFYFYHRIKRDLVMMKDELDKLDALSCPQKPTGV